MIVLLFKTTTYVTQISLVEDGTELTVPNGYFSKSNPLVVKIKGANEGIEPGPPRNLCLKCTQTRNHTTRPFALNCDNAQL